MAERRSNCGCEGNRVDENPSGKGSLQRVAECVVIKAAVNHGLGFFGTVPPTQVIPTVAECIIREALRRIVEPEPPQQESRPDEDRSWDPFTK